MLGYPIWHGNIPNIVMTLLESLNFDGKTIYPFNTHGGSGLGNSINDIKNLAPNAIVKDGFPLSGTYARTNESHEDIEDWLEDKLGIDVTDVNDTNDDDENVPTVQKEGNFLKVSLFLLLSALFFI